MKKYLRDLMVIVIAVFVAVQFTGGEKKSVEEETVYDRVMKTGKIRCGYFNWYPSFIKDPKTGQFKGIAYDSFTEIGKLLGLKVEWVEEVGLGEYPAALENGRIDMMCSSIWLTSERARAADFTSPLFYLPLYPYVQKGDNRFNEGVEVANNPKYTVSVLEGGATESIKRQLLSKAKDLTLPLLTPPSDLFLTLQTGKADIVIYDSFTYGDYNKNNPNKIIPISDKPLKIFPNVAGVAIGEHDFRRMINNAITELELTGTLDKIIKKHDIYGTLINVNKPYKR